ncbi:phage holin family protein [Eikenella sp. S3360]|uniref:Phage holin family protein n=1 Tax=Eikenella glucosivorans TaxID=2766967 RepID=A0ABS0NDE2_9NEIS|nr:phage holin family protein [Eikenella glucosivorans]MBH5330264.1 phage holin family protein [Eikenella glucosivorans]
MSLKQNIDHFRFLMNQGVDLLLLRLQILGIDLSDQAAGLVRMFAAVAVGGVMLLSALISLLFGLDAVLPAQAKAWVFFGLPVLLLLIAWVALARAASGWRQAGFQVASTLADMRRDIDTLRGRSPNHPNAAPQTDNTEQAE